MLGVVWSRVRAWLAEFGLRLVAVVAVLAVVATVGWWGADRWRRWQHCGTTLPTVHSRDDQCLGVTDGRADPEVFGREYRQIMSLIAQENARAMREPAGYVTVAFAGPLRPHSGPRDPMGAAVDPADPTTSRTLQQLEGAYVAQVNANRARTFPKIRLAVANLGADQTPWRTTVDHLAQMTGAPDRLVAVVGMGLSQQESIDAARALATAKPRPIPMVADIITADGFNATGAIDGRGPIGGLVRTAIDVGTQLKILDGHLAKQKKRPKTAALVWSQVTPRGTPDLYARTLKDGFTNPRLGFKRLIDAGNMVFPFDPRSGDTVLRTISDTLCGRQPDVVLYAGRQAYLPTFLKMLHGRPCHATPLTVIAGSETTGQRRDDPSLNDKSAPITLVYVPLADPTQLGSADNPDRGLFTQFATDFASHRFPAAHLQTGWAVLAHDATLTAAGAIARSALAADGTTHRLPTTDAVRGQLFLHTGTNAVRGASGVFRIDTTTGDRINS
ncbi:hypothetical protein ACSNOI_46030, partial [Actinomadura kijaniata]|uniref:hypothetical protein n=1 Tax=Actinomadura kijaniata TaxID=46161 RepID=UPI003F1B4935